MQIYALINTCNYQYKLQQFFTVQSMMMAISLIVVYLSAIVIQLVVDFNILGPVELAYGTFILIYSARVRPRPKAWMTKIIGLLIAILLVFGIIAEERNPEPFLPLPNYLYALIQLGVIVFFLAQTGAFIRLDTENEWQERLKRACFITAFALFITIIFYHPFNASLMLPIGGFLGHTILGFAYFYSFNTIEQYSDQHVLQLEDDELLYRQFTE